MKDKFIKVTELLIARDTIRDFVQLTDRHHGPARYPIMGDINPRNNGQRSMPSISPRPDSNSWVSIS